MANAARIATLVKTVLVEAIQLPDHHIQFRVEIFSWSEQEYSCQVWRYDTYRIQPTFVEPSMLADEEWMVLDLALDWRDLRATTSDQLLDLVYEEIERRFGVAIARAPAATPPPGSAT
jgi:hypothetical protein